MGGLSIVPVNTEAAGALFAKELRVRRPFVLHDGEGYGLGVGRTFRKAAGKLGLEVAGFARWDRHGRGLGKLAEQVKRARPGCSKRYATSSGATVASPGSP